MLSLRSYREGRPLTISKTAVEAPPTPAPPRKAVLKPPKKVASEAPSIAQDRPKRERRVRSSPKPEKPADGPPGGSGRSWRHVLGFR